MVAALHTTQPLIQQTRTHIYMSEVQRGMEFKGGHIAAQYTSLF